MTVTKVRCAWAGTDPLNIEYHDREWGFPERDEARLFEMITLEGAQAGLSWLTILRKREGYRKAFAGFDPQRVADFDDKTVEELVLDASIVRHRGKIESTINNIPFIPVFILVSDPESKRCVIIESLSKQIKQFIDCGILTEPIHYLRRHKCRIFGWYLKNC